MRYDHDTLAAISDLTVYELASLADTYADNEDAEGFLDGIRIGVLEAADYIEADDWEREMVEDYSGQAHTIADGAPSIWTMQKWTEFVGTRAYHEDPVGEFGHSGEDMDQLASVALYMIAQRLVAALVTEIHDSLLEDEGEE